MTELDAEDQMIVRHILPIEGLLTGLLQFPGNCSLSQNYQPNQLESRMSSFLSLNLMNHRGVMAGWPRRSIAILKHERRRSTVGESDVSDFLHDYNGIHDEL